ncbi:hypothetical protein [Corallococcus carmarthensis]|uniref:Uncharacterized protein n=1 Tax=Corallococcus carmarthensis TaxID=2316728 RepID=A0A3A8KA83_9BACT|nr:hypothetical protein [Corallococcus carmarthensis]RKH05073.1 hypothetical protein D7X32_09155 [Corallococcus carmarthensis]
MSTAPAASGFDLSSLIHHDTLTVDILHPVTGQPTGMQVEVAGMDSPRYRDATRSLIDRATASAPRAGRRARQEVPRDMEADALELLVSCTVSWTGVMEHGAAVPLTPDNARRLFTAHPWLRRQVDEAVGDRASFFEEKPSDSSTSPVTNSA